MPARRCTACGISYRVDLLKSTGGGMAPRFPCLGCGGNTSHMAGAGDKPDTDSEALHKAFESWLKHHDWDAKQAALERQRRAALARQLKKIQGLPEAA